MVDDGTEIGCGVADASGAKVDNAIEGVGLSIEEEMKMKSGKNYSP